MWWLHRSVPRAGGVAGLKACMCVIWGQPLVLPEALRWGLSLAVDSAPGGHGRGGNGLQMSPERATGDDVVLHFWKSLREAENKLSCLSKKRELPARVPGRRGSYCFLLFWAMPNRTSGGLSWRRTRWALGWSDDYLNTQAGKSLASLSKVTISEPSAVSMEPGRPQSGLLAASQLELIALSTVQARRRSLGVSRHPGWSTFYDFEGLQRGF